MRRILRPVVAVAQLICKVWFKGADWEVFSRFCAQQDLSRAVVLTRASAEESGRSLLG